MVTAPYSPPSTCSGALTAPNLLREKRSHKWSRQIKHKAASHTLSHGASEANFQKPPLTHLEPQLLGSREPKQVHLSHHRDVAKARNLGSDTALSRSPLNYDSKYTDYYFLYNSSQSSSGAWTQHIRKEWSNENRDTNSKGELNTEENKLRKYKCVWRQSSGATPLLEPPRLQSKPWPSATGACSCTFLSGRHRGCPPSESTWHL